MTYLKRSNRGNKKATQRAIMAAGILALVIAIRFIFPSFYPAVFYPIASIFWKAESSIGGTVGSLADIVHSKYSLVTENRRLSDEVAADNRSMLLMDSLKAENDSLKAVLGRTGKQKAILGTILSRPPVSAYDTLVIDIGSSDGVKAGDKVYAEGDVLLGDVVDAYSGESKVSLYSTAGRTTPVLVGTSTIATTATGRGGGNFTLKLPTSAKVAVGAVISLPHLHLQTFGVVQKIVVDSTDSLQTIFFNAPVNINELRFVEVIQ